MRHLHKKSTESAPNRSQLLLPDNSRLTASFPDAAIPRIRKWPARIRLAETLGTPRLPQHGGDAVGIPDRPRRYRRQCRLKRESLFACNPSLGSAIRRAATWSASQTAWGLWTDCCSLVSLAGTRRVTLVPIQQKLDGDARGLRLYHR